MNENEGGPAGTTEPTDPTTEELRRARLLLERAEEMAKIGSWEFDYARRTVSASPGALRIYGVEAPLSVSAMEQVPLPEYRQLLNQVRDDHIRYGTPYDVEFKIRRQSDGAILDIYSRAVWDANHKRLFGILMDVTDRKRAEAEIVALNLELERRVEERTSELRIANEALSKALLDLSESRERRILAEKMATLGRLVASLAHELNTPLAAILSASESEIHDARGFDADLRAVRAFSPGEFEVLSTIVRGSLVPGTGSDQARKRQARKEYGALLGRLGIDEGELVAEELVDSGFDGSLAELEAMAAVGDFPAVAHTAYRLSSFFRANFIVHSAAEKSAAVVAALKTYSYQGSPERLGSVDLREQLETALLIYQSRLRGGIEVERRFGEAPAIVQCYPDRLGQVWVNLVSNAVHAMGQKGLLELEIEQEEDGLRVSVIDDGPGIPPENQAKIFEPFFTTKAPGEGSGLGLDICRKMLSEIGATLSFESRPGRTRFSAYIPRHLPPRPGEGPASAEEAR